MIHSGQYIRLLDSSHIIVIVVILYYTLSSLSILLLLINLIYSISIEIEKFIFFGFKSFSLISFFCFSIDFTLIYIYNIDDYWC